MKQLRVFIRKEFYHIFRDRRTLLIMFGLPVVQIMLFGFALSNEVRDIRIAVVDNAQDADSRQLITKIGASPSFVLTAQLTDYQEIAHRFRNGDIKGAVVIPPAFGADLGRGAQTTVQIITDGSDPNIAKTMVNYLTAVIGDYSGDQRTAGGTAPAYRIEPVVRMLYNEEGNGSLNFIPGVMALILMIVCTALTSVSVVKEKETGTMEILLVSPFRPLWVLLAKAVPYLLLSLANFTLILVLAVYVLDVQIKGSVVLLYLESTLFIITCLSFGLLISNVTNDQQTALLISLMGMMLPTLIFTGFIMPVENMPRFFRIVSNVVPSRWYFLIIKAVMLKGLGFGAVWKETLVLAGMTVFLLIVALKKFKLRLQ